MAPLGGRGARPAAAEGNGGGEQPDEPEALVLLVACGIGLATGGGVVLFNYAIHAIQVPPPLPAQLAPWWRTFPAWDRMITV